jgi:oligoribonuclease
LYAEGALMVSNLDKDNNLVWIDLEMTGLEDDHLIIEIASIVTNGNLEELAEGPSLAINRSISEMQNINDWSKEQHHTSGLLKRVTESTVTISAAENQTLTFLKKWVSVGQSPICGNSIGTDRRFIRREMPQLDKFLHYRMIDVSTIKELARRWYPKADLPEKEGAHLALEDIRESIEELRWYRKTFFNTEIQL